MTIYQLQFKKELWKYFSFVYVGIMFLGLVVAGLVEGISTSNMIQIALWGFFTLSWSYILMRSCYNIYSLIKAIFRKREFTNIKEVMIVTSITNRSLEKREFKLIMLFVTICYLTGILLTIMENH
ncbi:hypothetical protein LNTAR_15377 [Lentisphaera araneosa HTCC2155]|uniref:Uncharacterized protein n=1 Tax=Lentisphaera araneosa HTCC2155 TaxID=313628 RepID=A6DU60_9BACT|nr:hypothetical protein LNTAR_15377 [Lentisphaera araneosa HTCC2155]